MGANAKTGIAWLDNKIGINHLLRLFEVETKIANIVPINIPKIKDKIISSKVVCVWFKIS